MPVQTAIRNPAVLSYHALRRALGVIALCLPIMLACGAIAVSLVGPGHALPRPLVQRSISDYYYTPVGSCYVGSLFVIAAFLMCSRGYDRLDEVAGYVAGAFALGVALFPSESPYKTRYSQVEVVFGYVHTAFAALLFLAVAFFCLFLFTRSSPQVRITRHKRHRNRIYAVCGVVIVVCMVGMVSLTLEGVAEWLWPVHPLLVCESLALAAFGVAWLTKGEGLLRDSPRERGRD